MRRPFEQALCPRNSVRFSFCEGTVQCVDLVQHGLDESDSGKRRLDQRPDFQLLVLCDFFHFHCVHNTMQFLRYHAVVEPHEMSTTDK
jgi:hypothetical protein